MSNTANSWNVNRRNVRSYRETPVHGSQENLGLADGRKARPAGRLRLRDDCDVLPVVAPMLATNRRPTVAERAVEPKLEGWR
jgi:hypothetical protein